MSVAGTATNKRKLEEETHTNEEIDDNDDNDDAEMSKITAAGVDASFSNEQLASLSRDYDFLPDHFRAMESTGRPGTPHRYFRASYQSDKESHDAQVRLHFHANGLVVVTTPLPAGAIIESIDFVADAAIHSTTAAKTTTMKASNKSRRKNGNNSTKQHKDPSYMQATDTLCIVHYRLENQLNQLPVVPGIAGWIVEINDNHHRLVATTADTTRQAGDSEAWNVEYLAIIQPDTSLRRTANQKTGKHRRQDKKLNTKKED